MEIKQECSNHDAWDKQLFMASIIFMCISLYGIFFTEGVSIAIAGLLAAFAIGITRILLDVKHAKWHFEEERRKDDGQRG